MTGISWEDEVFLFINKEDWLKFAERLAGHPIICKNKVAMYGTYKTEGKNDAQALCKLCLAICKEQDKLSLWDDFVSVGLKSDEYRENVWDAMLQEMNADD